MKEEDFIKTDTVFQRSPKKDSKEGLQNINFKNINLDTILYKTYFFLRKR